MKDEDRKLFDDYRAISYPRLGSFRGGVNHIITRPPTCLGEYICLCDSILCGIPQFDDPNKPMCKTCAKWARKTLKKANAQPKLAE